MPQSDWSHTSSLDKWVGNLGFFLKKHWRNTVYSNVWISLGAAATTWQTFVLFHLDIHWIYCVFVGFATLATYNFQRIVKFSHRPEYLAAGRNNWLFRNRAKLTFIVIFASIGMLFTVFKLPTATFPLLAGMSVISLLYVVRFFPVKGQLLAFRDMPFLKVYLIALVWTTVSVVIPIAGEALGDLQWDTRLTTSIIEKFAFLVAITIPFDIRDMHFDDPKQRTIPQLFGPQMARTLAFFFATVSLLASAFLYLTGWYSELTLIAFALSAGVNMYFIAHSHPNKSEMYFAGGVDSTLLIQAALVALSLVERSI